MIFTSNLWRNDSDNLEFGIFPFIEVYELQLSKLMDGSMPSKINRIIQRCYLTEKPGQQVGVPPLGGFICKAFLTRPPKGGTPTLENAFRFPLPSLPRNSG